LQGGVDLLEKISREAKVKIPPLDFLRNLRKNLKGGPKEIF
jgi:hypothetical protein